MAKDKVNLGKKPAIKEAEITRQIRDYLKIMNIFHWKVMQGLGCTAGISDIIAVKNGKAIAIEVKTHKGKLSSFQRNFLDNFKAAGGITIVARSVEDVIEGLK